VRTAIRATPAACSGSPSARWGTIVPSACALYRLSNTSATTVISDSERATTGSSDAGSPSSDATTAPP
jgi:hypothetical protein